MSVVVVKTYQVSNRDQAITQVDLDSLSTTVNAFLARLDPTTILDVRNAYFPVGKYGTSAFAITVVYLQ